MVSTRTLEQARTAMAEGNWRDAYALLAAADAQSELPVDDQERLGLAAFLTGHDQESTRAWSRAHRVRWKAGEPEKAAHDAFLIGTNLMFRGELAPAQGWLSRGGSLLEGRPEAAEHGWLRTLNALARMFLGDPTGAIPEFGASAEIARRHGDADLLATAQVGEGWSRLLVGDLDNGRRLLDVSMVGVVAGEVSAMYAGIAYCSMVAACADVFDVRRAREWTEALTRFVDAQPGLVPFRGNCLVHRCQLQRLAGAWSEALDIAQEACAQLSGPVTWDTLGSAYYQLGEVQRLRGDLAAAEQSYLRGNEAGHPPEPGLALLRLTQGRVEVAAAMLSRALGETTAPAARAALLPAQVEVLLRAGDIQAATSAADELQVIAKEIGAPYLGAVAATAGGAVVLAEGDARAALPQLRAASDQWRDLDCPHDLARVRVMVGLACRALDDDETADVELDGARATFERLGAAPDLARLEALGAPGQVAVTAEGVSPTARELEVLRLIAGGLTNRAIASRLGLSEKTVARHVHNLLTRLDVPSRAAATAYAYEHGLI
jgi:DNA-binding CsgD family transcriptional regulator